VVRLKNHSLAGLLLHMSTSHEYSALSGRESGKSLSLDPAHRLGCSSVAALILLWSCLLALSTLVGVMSGYIAGVLHF
jgi:ABC-type transporter Mla maintaining outer membrane lipid asymmetry permease subunit MlaE